MTAKMENSSRKEMIKSLSEIVIPVLRQNGFRGTFPHFRRITKEKINLMTFQFDKYGGGFVIEIANCEPSGFTTHWGQKIEPNKLTAHYVSGIRIQSNMDTTNSFTEDWFRYDNKNSSNMKEVYINVCKDVLSKLKFAENYWENKN